MSQAHSKFRVFLADGPLTQTVLDNVSTDLQGSTLAPKSVGVEYLEAQKKTVLSIGYSDAVGHPYVKLVQEDMGEVELTTQAIAEALSKAAGKHENVICHEFYVTDNGNFYAVLMLQA